MAKLTIEAGFLNIIKNMDNRPHYAIGEFIDNSIQSFEQNKELLEKTVGYRPWVKINVRENTITVEDNCAGIAKSDEERAFSLAKSNPDKKGIGTYGMGMKVSGCWFTDTWIVESKNVKEKEKKIWTIDVKKVTKDPNTDIGPKRKANDGHSGTKITLKNCFENTIPRTTAVTTMKDYLADIYRWYILDKRVDIYYNDELLEYSLPKIKVMPLHTEQYGKPEVPREIWDNYKNLKWYAQIPKIQLGKNENGELWAEGLVYLRDSTAGQNKKGFSIFWKNRLVEGMVSNPWMPGSPSWTFDSQEDKNKYAIYADNNRAENILLEGYLHVSPNFKKNFQTNALDWEDKKELLAQKLKEIITSTPLHIDGKINTSHDGKNYDFLEQVKKGRWKERPIDATKGGDDDDDDTDGGLGGDEGGIIFGPDGGDDTTITTTGGETPPEPEKPDDKDKRQVTRDFKYNGVVYKTTIFFDYNENDHYFSHNDGPRPDVEASENGEVQTLQIRVNFGHHFIQRYFSRINGEEEREGLSELL